MDWLGKLPVEISQNILSFLDPEDLASCSAVSKKWRELCNYDSLWKRHAYLYSVLPDYVPLSPEHKSSLVSLCHWKRVFTKFVGNVRTNWVNQECKVLTKTHSGGIVDKTSCDGTTLVISYINGFVEVYNLVLLKLIQTIDITISGNEFVWVDVNSFYLCLCKSNIVSIYERNSDLKYDLINMFTVDAFGDIQWGLGEDFTKKYYRKGINVKLLLVKEISWCFDRMNEEVLLTNLETKNVLKTMDGKKYEDYKVFENRVFCRKSGIIDVYSEKGEFHYSLTKAKCVQINYLDVGKTMVSAVLVLMDERNMWKEVSTWDLQAGSLLHSFSVFEDSILRVALNEVVVLRFGYKNCSVSVHTPRNKETLWRKSFDYSANATIYEAKSSFFPITNKYLLCLPGPFNSAVLNLKTGDFISSPERTHSFLTKYNHFFSHAVVSFICNIDGVLLAIRTYV